ncbi:MAG: adenylosuccinate synthase [Candidatus Hydrogenedentota bacterium]
MPATLIVGIQWGDEGKGKITDLLADKYDCVVRYQGGDNAGHTVVKLGKKFKLHFVPSGILFKNKLAVMGNGMVVNLISLVKELDELKNNGIDIRYLRISDRAFTILPVHINEDKLKEDGSFSIGTTVKGIGPAYKDKINRTGIRIGDFFEPDIEKRLLNRELNNSEIKEQLSCFNKVKDYVCDTVTLLNDMHKKGGKILLEGAQATMLDIDFGTYPYVTSSSPSAGGACTGTGLPPSSIKKIIGISKAYTTRVGKGPFPTELTDKLGDLIREKGVEYGTTTGRPRRCGWLDLVALRYAINVCGVTAIAIMKLDVLSGLHEIKVAVGYVLHNKKLKCFPSRISAIKEVKVEYKTFKGWETDIKGIRKLKDLPIQAQRYIRFIEKEIGIPVKYISTSPDRKDTIIR